MRAWEYLGKSAEEAPFLHVKPGFYDSYVQAIETHRKKVFFVEEGGRKTFAEFDRDVRGAAANIRKLDADIVVTIAGNSYAHAVCIFATLLSGKILAPINCAETPEFVLRQLRKFDRKWTAFSDRAAHRPYARELKLTEEAPQDLPRPPKSGDFIYILTSGSTGESKFVRQTETGVLANVEALIRHHGLSGGRAIGTSLPLFHVNALEFSLFASFFSGGRLYLWKQFDAAGLRQSTGIEEVEIYSSIPMLIHAMSEVLPPGKLKSLDYFVSAATYLSADIVRSVFARHGRRILQGYGLSEAVNFSCTIPKEIPARTYREVAMESATPSIGTALWGNEVDILTEDGRPCAEGEAGDIYIRGWNVMPGYLGGESPDTSRGLKTGDRGFFKIYDGQTFYFFVGRTKDIIKRNGETIGLREIDEAVFAAGIAGLDSIAVPFKNDLRGEEVGLAIRVSSDIQTGWSRKLIEHLSGLSEARRPKVIVRVDSETLRTPSGKPLRWKFAPLFAKYERTVVFKPVELPET
jgi:acyl-CoA synthetase (AMP-forming)/AMP-acid ligase II